MTRQSHIQHQISDYPLSQTDQTWLDLPWPGCRISGSRLGDLGPAGNDLDGKSRRYAALLTTDWASGVSEPLLCKQVHSLRILVSTKGSPSMTAEGTFDAQGSLLLSHRTIGDTHLAESRIANFAGSVEADGIVSDDFSALLGVTVADCMPIFVRSKNFRAAVHSGWGGTGILAVALKCFEQLGETEVEILSGPCIAAEHYAVPPERAAIFATRFGTDAVKTCADGQPGLDMIAANRAILEWTAPCLARVEIPRLSWTWSYCTESTYTDLRLQSFRRDGGTERYGRMFAVFGPPT